MYGQQAALLQSGGEPPHSNGGHSDNTTAIRNRTTGSCVIPNMNTSDTNLYLFYKNSGGRGTNVFFLIGDPNALRFVKRISVKFVFAL